MCLEYQVPLPMASGSTEASFIVWGIDQTAYGPVELTTLVSWVKGERITPDTWIFAARDRSWQRASDLPELKMFFSGSGGGPAQSPESLRGIDLHALRRIKILAGMSDQQLERFAQFIEIERVPQGTVIAKQGDYDNTLYLVLEGELSVRMRVLDEDTVLATLGAGEFFGDIPVFDHGPRSVNVTTTDRSILVKITATAFQQLAKEAPDLATPFLLAIGKSQTDRIRAGRKDTGEPVHLRRSVDKNKS